MPAVTTDKLAKNLELIQQLLAKAESSTFPAEAQTFQEHAERLMVRYGIDKAQLDADAGRRGKPREAMVEKHFEVSGVYRVGQVRGLYYVAQAFNTVEVMESTYRNRTNLYLIGAESDVDQIIRLFTSIMLQVQTAMADWWLTFERKAWLDRPGKEAERRQFQLAFFVTVGDRLRALYREESTGSELVLVNRKERAAEYAHELHPQVRIARAGKLRGGSAQAAQAGAAAGNRADVYGGNVAAAKRAAVSA